MEFSVEMDSDSVMSDLAEKESGPFSLLAWSLDRKTSVKHYNECFDLVWDKVVFEVVMKSGAIGSEKLAWCGILHRMMQILSDNEVITTHETFDRLTKLFSKVWNYENNYLKVFMITFIAYGLSVELKLSYVNYKLLAKSFLGLGDVVRSTDVDDWTDSIVPLQSQVVTDVLTTAEVVCGQDVLPLLVDITLFYQRPSLPRISHGSVSVNGFALYDGTSVIVNAFLSNLWYADTSSEWRDLRLIMRFRFGISIFVPARMNVLESMMHCGASCPVSGLDTEPLIVIAPSLIKRCYSYLYHRFGFDLEVSSGRELLDCVFTQLNLKLRLGRLVHARFGVASLLYTVKSYFDGFRLSVFGQQDEDESVGLLVGTKEVGRFSSCDICFVNTLTLMHNIAWDESPVQDQAPTRYAAKMCRMCYQNHIHSLCLESYVTPSDLLLFFALQTSNTVFEAYYLDEPLDVRYCRWDDEFKEGGDVLIEGWDEIPNRTVTLEPISAENFNRIAYSFRVGLLKVWYDEGFKEAANYFFRYRFDLKNLPIIG